MAAAENWTAAVSAPEVALVELDEPARTIWVESAAVPVALADAAAEAAIPVSREPEPEASVLADAASSTPTMRDAVPAARELAADATRMLVVRSAAATGAHPTEPARAMPVDR